MNAPIIGLYLWGIITVLYLVAVWKLSFWRDGPGLKVLRLLYVAILIHSIQSMVMRFLLIKGQTVDDWAPWAMLGQLVLLYAGLRALVILYGHFEKDPTVPSK